MNRPSFVDYFMAIALVASQRSHDQHTQHGCVIADSCNRILSIGYNGFPREVDDASLPITRPEKYKWMVHAEANALANCLIRPDGATVYVTGDVCLDCGIQLWQHGIKNIFSMDRHGTHLMDENMKKDWDILLAQTGMKLTKIKPNVEWAKNYLVSYDM